MSNPTLKNKEKEIIEEMRSKLFKKLKRYNIQFGCFDEVFKVLEQALFQQKEKFKRMVKETAKEHFGDLPALEEKFLTDILNQLK